MSAYPRVLVRRDGMTYVCEWKRATKQTPERLKCGQCRHGVVLPQMDRSCGKCGAFVVRIEG